VTTDATRIVILGAGFGGLELSTRLSSAFGAGVDVTLIDKNEAFVFGFSKFELLFGRESLEQVRSYYRDIVKPGVQFRQELVVSIDPIARRVVTDQSTYNADVLVVALGAEYDFSVPPGFQAGGYEFYSIEGALRLRDVLPSLTTGKVIIAVLGEPFKCPPAPCEAAMLLDEYFTERGVRSLPDQRRDALGQADPAVAGRLEGHLDRFVERNIGWMPGQLVTVSTREEDALMTTVAPSYDLFLGIRSIACRPSSRSLASLSMAGSRSIEERWRRDSRTCTRSET
jgi:sulfide:quinone oxidoreductase